MINVSTHVLIWKTITVERFKATTIQVLSIPSGYEGAWVSIWSTKTSIRAYESHIIAPVTNLRDMCQGLNSLVLGDGHLTFNKESL